MDNISNPGQTQYAVYDFAQDGLVRPVIDPITPDYTETFEPESTFTQAVFNLDPIAPESKLDFATISSSGLFIIGRYTEETIANVLGTEGVIFLTILLDI